MPSKKVQVAIVVGFAVLLAALDWIVNKDARYAIAVAVGAAVGLLGLVARKAWRGRDRS
jgi:hypothetical protein